MFRIKNSVVNLLILTGFVCALAGEAAAQARTKIRYALGDVISIDELPLLIAVERAKARGVDVEITAFKSEELATQAVINGQADVGQGTPYAALQKVTVPIRFFVQLSALQFFPIVNKESYKSWKDLDNQEIAVQGRGSGTEAIMILAAKQHGIKFKNISYVPGSQVRALALLKGNIKASILDAPNKNVVMKEAPDKFIILPLGNVKASDEALFATREFIDKNQAGIRVFIEELVKVNRAINANPRSVLDERLVVSDRRLWSTDEWRVALPGVQPDLGHLSVDRALGLGQYQQRRIVAAQNRIKWASLGLTVPAQSIVLTLHICKRKGAARPLVRAEVRHIGELGHLSQCDALAPACEQNWDVRLLHWPQPDTRVRDPKVLAVVGERRAIPQPADDRDRLFERRLALGCARERYLELGELIGIVADADAEHQPTVAQLIHIGRHARDHRWAAIIDAADQRDQANSFSDSRERGQHRKAIKRTRRMVVGPVRIKSKRLGLLHELNRPRPIGEGSAHDSEADFIAPGCNPRVRGMHSP